MNKKNRKIKKKKLTFILSFIFSFLVVSIPAIAHISPGVLTNPNSTVSNLDLNPENQIQIAATNSSTNSSNLLTEGEKYYQTERYNSAIEIWKQAAEKFEQQADKLSQSQSLNYLSLAYQKLGQWEEAEQAINQSLELLPTSKLNETGHQILAQSLNTKGKLELAKGEAEAAFYTWEKAEKEYNALNDKIGVIGSKINQVRALQDLGMYLKSKTILEEVATEIEPLTPSLVKITALRSLGIGYQMVGDLEKSQQILEQSLKDAAEINPQPDVSGILLSMGNNAQNLGEIATALTYYQQAAETDNIQLKIKAELNQFKILVNQENWEEAQALAAKIELNLTKLAPSRTAIYAKINYADNLVKLNLVKLEENQKIALILATAIKEAREIKDIRAETEALGALAGLYEQTKQLKEAQELTEEALLIAQRINAAEIAYKWQWQLGRIEQEKGEREKAIAFYKKAVENLQNLRTDLGAVNQDLQFSFQENIEPVYREFVELLLAENPTKADLITARETIENLQLAELDNFFRDACVQKKEIDNLDKTAATIYPIILPKSLAVIVSIPEQPLSLYQTELPKEEVEKTIIELRESLNPVVPQQIHLNLAQKVYNWLIKPTEVELENHQIKTLVFVLDGVLRNQPMTTLYDGEKYLIEKYSIAITPGLQLMEPTVLTTKEIQVLMGGLSKERPGFSPLPAVETEVNEIAATSPSEVLLNEDFTEEKLQEYINALPYPVVHLATHGQFSSNQEDTFILTWNEKIDIKQLETLIKGREIKAENVPIEMLVLSACQTAYGDNRAALGLAGLAVRSGARSTVASLWSVDDQSTAQLMVKFYQQLSLQGVSKAEALRKAQLKLLQTPQYNHPYYWSAFVLLGNWL